MSFIILCLQVKSKKPRTNNYTGIPLKLVNTTFNYVCAWLACEGMFPNPVDYDLEIRRCWKTAAAELRVNVNEYPIDDDHVVCVSFPLVMCWIILLTLTQIKDRVNSYRGRIRDRVKPPIASVYELASKSGTELINHVEWLLQQHFYKKVSNLLGLRGTRTHMGISLAQNLARVIISTRS
jgi:hypothetical protein